MHRATPVDTIFRAMNGSGARAIIDKVADGKLMQELSAGFFKGEKRGKIEHTQNYGFTSNVFEPDKDEKGNITDAAQGIVNFIGGSRGFPMIGALDDRRHRLQDLASGDSAMFRGRQDGQQFLMHALGNFMSARNDKKIRFALVPNKVNGHNPNQSGGGGGGGAQSRAAPMAATEDVESRNERGIVPGFTPSMLSSTEPSINPEPAVGIMPMAAAAGGGGGGGGSGAGGQQGEQKKEKGQKSVYDENLESETFFEQSQDATSIMQEKNKGMKLAKKHVLLRYGDFAFWIDDEGLHCTHPITQKALPKD